MFGKNAWSADEIWPGDGDTQIWFDVQLKPPKPLSIFKGDFARKGYPFLGIFLKISVHFSQFLGVRMANTWKFWKDGPMFRDIFVENGTHV